MTAFYLSLEYYILRNLVQDHIKFCLDVHLQCKIICRVKGVVLKLLQLRTKCVSQFCQVNLATRPTNWPVVH